MTDNISRESVIKAITALMLNDIGGRRDWGKKAATENPEEQERIRQHIKGIEESIVTLMKLADELGLYEEVDRRIVIPPHLKEDYWGTGASER